MRIDIMTDIETLGRGNDTTVFQIAACAFDIKTGEVLNTFNQIVNIKRDNNISIDGGTLIWWLNTNKELLTTLLNSGTASQKEMFINFKKWIEQLQEDAGRSDEVFLWGNGILFDNKLIQSKMKEYNIEYPIFYRNDRDMRTIVELAALKCGIKTEKEFRTINRGKEYVEHDGYDDVKAQIEVLSKSWNILLNNK